MFSFSTIPSFKPEALLNLAEQFSDFPGTCLLYSGGQFDSSQKSILGLFPYESLMINNHQLTYLRGNRLEQSILENPWEGLDFFFKPTCSLDYAFGYFGYEMGAFADQEKQLPYREAPIPDAYWQRCALVVEVDHTQNLAKVICAEQALVNLPSNERTWIEHFVHQSRRRETYLNQVACARDYICAGEIYQVNLAHLFQYDNRTHPFVLFKRMTKKNPAPFSAYLKGTDFTLVCTSPERFLQKQGNQLETRPIKGTAPRGKTLEQDDLFKQQLLDSPKERAELLMITDLMRNDLGKVSETGTVKVKELWRCEAYTNVFHLLSIIQAQVKAGLSPIEIIRACFPGGSVTGCPKLRAMEIIYELETQPRGVYTGSIGYIKGNGDFDLNIAIRTLVCRNNKIHLHLGSGIVFDSNGPQEYQETLFKGATLFEVLCQN